MYRKRTVIWPFYFYTIIRTLSDFEKIITSPEDPRPIGVIPDSRGILRSLHCLRNLGYLKEIVILVSTATPKEYLNYLEERHYPYIVSGNDHVDYEKAFQILHEQYGCKYMRTDSGGGLTNKLLENGLIDEISLVISPCFVGNKEKQLFDNLLLSEKVNLELQGTENAEHGCLSLRYAVKNKD
ncbi:MULTISPECIES: dihydrofolate reductase family protein [Staphylococcus]|uniref:dihydrofolate reductase family protein n=1 Tax=Staphylococcus TaxID=1279 RepID=UPI0005C7A4E6